MATVSATAALATAAVQRCEVCGLLRAQTQIRKSFNHFPPTVCKMQMTGQARA